MDFPEFKSLIVRIYTYYDIRHPSPQSLDEKFKKVEHIPTGISGEVADFIFDWILGNYDTPPRNTAKAFKMAWWAWKSANSNRMITERTECRYCLGEGVLVYLVVDKGTETDPGTGRVIQVVARCASCENWKRIMGEVAAPARFRADLERDGYEIVHPIDHSRAALPPAHDRRSLQEMAGDVFTGTAN